MGNESASVRQHQSSYIHTLPKKHEAAIVSDDLLTNLQTKWLSEVSLRPIVIRNKLFTMKSINTNNDTNIKLQKYISKYGKLIIHHCAIQLVLTDGSNKPQTYIIFPHYNQIISDLCENGEQNIIKNNITQRISCGVARYIWDDNKPEKEEKKEEQDIEEKKGDVDEESQQDQMFLDALSSENVTIYGNNYGYIDVATAGKSRNDIDITLTSDGVYEITKIVKDRKDKHHLAEECGLSVEQAERCIEYYDEDGDGTLNESEFQDLKEQIIRYHSSSRDCTVRDNDKQNMFDTRVYQRDIKIKLGCEGIYDELLFENEEFMAQCILPKELLWIICKEYIGKDIPHHNVMDFRISRPDIKCRDKVKEYDLVCHKLRDDGRKTERIVFNTGINVFGKYFNSKTIIDIDSDGDGDLRARNPYISKDQYYVMDDIVAGMYYQH